MKLTTESLLFTVPVPLPVKAHRMAENICRQTTSPQSAKQIYLNTLAVYAVDFYLKCMGIETDLSASDSQNPINLIFSTVADLVVKDLGKLECIPVVADSNYVEIPLEAWSDRIGYVVVRMSDSLRSATILGFVQKPTMAEISINQLQPLTYFLEYMESLSKPPINLSNWLEDIFETGWEAVESMLKSLSPELGFNFRGSKDALIVQRGQILNLKDESHQDSLALIVGIIPSVGEEMDILVRVYPTGNKTYLPDELELSILDENEKAIMQAQARGSDHLKFQLGGEAGDYFKVMVVLGEAKFTESFLL